MSNTMTAHEPINYLDSILNEEEKRCEYSHQWRNYTISRSGRFKSKNKKRDVVDGNFFNAATAATTTSTTCCSSKDQHSHKEQEKISARPTASVFNSKSPFACTTAATNTTTNTARNQRDKKESYKSFYETNL